MSTHTDEAAASDTQYIEGPRVPRSVPPGRVLAHNHVWHRETTPPGERGFRAWTWPLEKVPSNFAPCPCGWAGLPHHASARFVEVEAEERKLLHRQAHKEGREAAMKEAGEEWDMQNAAERDDAMEQAGKEWDMQNASERDQACEEAGREYDEEHEDDE